MQRVRNILEVVRIDRQGLFHILGGSGQPADDERAIVARAAGDVLLGHQVHAVAQGRNQGHVGGGIEDRERRA